MVQPNEFSTETLEGKVPVASLEAMFGRDDLDAGGKVYKSDRAFNLIAVLAARSTAAKGMELHFLEEDVRIGVVAWHVGIPGHSPRSQSRRTGSDAGSCNPVLQQSGPAEGVGHDAFRFVVGRVFLDLERFDFLNFNRLLFFFLKIAYGK